MGHTPYGYRIENGKAVIDEEKAAQVRMIFTEYLSGTALCPAARKAGLSMTHSSVKHLLTNSRYLGNDFYPAIIDEDTFLKAAEQLKARAQMLGRDNRGRNRISIRAREGRTCIISDNRQEMSDRQYKTSGGELSGVFIISCMKTVFVYNVI